MIVNRCAVRTYGITGGPGLTQLFTYQPLTSKKIFYRKWLDKPILECRMIEEQANTCWLLCVNSKLRKIFMPNWCLNNLTIEHSDSSMVDRFEQAYNLGKTCNEFIPMPKDIGDGWWDFAVNNWGTKWDIGADISTEWPERYGLKATRVGNQVSGTFDSAWAPPVGLYDKLVELGYSVKATYFEPGMAFCGIYDNGVDNYIEYTNKDMIPVALWNEYDMEEFFADDEVQA